MSAGGADGTFLRFAPCGVEKVNDTARRSHRVTFDQEPDDLGVIGAGEFVHGGGLILPMCARSSIFQFVVLSFLSVRDHLHSPVFYD